MENLAGRHRSDSGQSFKAKPLFWRKNHGILVRGRTGHGADLLSIPGHKLRHRPTITTHQLRLEGLLGWVELRQAREACRKRPTGGPQTTTARRGRRFRPTLRDFPAKPASSQANHPISRYNSTANSFRGSFRVAFAHS